MDQLLSEQTHLTSSLPMCAPKKAKTRYKICLMAGDRLPPSILLSITRIGSMVPPTAAASAHIFYAVGNVQHRLRGGLHGKNRADAADHRSAKHDAEGYEKVQNRFG
ncbi:hypothetical protein XI25_16930 [Paenibacillus sp. DMB20]|nr:hypothetical protein XI25_16930 [Paenibacillus sp. DMB20]